MQDYDRNQCELIVDRSGRRGLRSPLGLPAPVPCGRRQGRSDGTRRRGIALPALRDRGPDILLLADHFLALHAKRYGREGLELSVDARQCPLEFFLALSKTIAHGRARHCTGFGPPGRARTRATAVCRRAQAHCLTRRAGSGWFAASGAADHRYLAVCRRSYRTARRGARGDADADFQWPDPGHLSQRVMTWTEATRTWRSLDESSRR